MKQPDITPIKGQNGRPRYRLNEDYAFSFKGQIFIIKKGFEYDGASVPRFLWSLTGIRPDGLHRAAALIHDFLYDKARKGQGAALSLRGQLIYFSRKEADRQFYEDLVKTGVKNSRAKLMYRAVRLFGWTVW